MERKRIDVKTNLQKQTILKTNKTTNQNKNKTWLHKNYTKN